jgi:hypothetical protein
MFNYDLNQLIATKCIFVIKVDIFFDFIIVKNGDLSLTLQYRNYENAK